MKGCKVGIRLDRPNEGQRWRAIVKRPQRFRTNSRPERYKKNEKSKKFSLLLYWYILKLTFSITSFCFWIGFSSSLEYLSNIAGLDRLFMIFEGPYT